MSWETLTPLSAPRAAPMLSAQVRVLKNGQTKVNMFLSTFLVDEMGGGAAVTVQAGTDADAGKLRLVFGEGPFSVKDVMRFARLSIPVPAGVEARDTPTAPCRIIAKDVKARELVIELPLEAWRPPVPVQRPAAPAAGSNGSGPPSPARPLDPVDYLRTKGHKVEPLAAGRLQVDGTVMTRGQVLSLINSHRAKADLDPLPHAAVA